MIALFLIFAIINILSTILLYKLSNTSLEIFNSKWGFAPLTYIAAFSGIVCIIIFSKSFTLKPVKYIGENSLVYYAWHQSIFINNIYLLLHMDEISITTGASVITVMVLKLSTFFVTIILLTICNIIISKTKFRVFIGK